MPTVRTDDAEIYYETHGQGQPFLFFSETACDGQIWKLYQVPEFAKDPKVKEREARSFVDDTLVKELEDSGFIKSLYGR